MLAYDARDAYPATAVEPFLAGADPRAPTQGPDVVYGHVVRGTDGREWLQYWRFSTYNPQDRGIVRTGRHEGARGSHGRPWPDPNDEARADGRRARPRVVRVTSRTPAWVTRREPWGRSRASWVPAENGSPLGPMFQSTRAWQDPAGYDAGARACGSGAPGLPVAARVALGGAAAVVLGTVVGPAWWWRRRRGRR